MSVTLERLDERTQNHASDLSDLRADVAALKLEVKAAWRMIYLGSGTVGGMGLIGGLLVPGIMKAMGWG